MSIEGVSKILKQLLAIERHLRVLQLYLFVDEIPIRGIGRRAFQTFAATKTPSKSFPSTNFQK